MFQLDGLTDQFELLVQQNLENSFYTRTEGLEVGVDFSRDTIDDLGGLFASNSTIAQDKELQDQITEVVRLIREDSESIENNIKAGERDIAEAESRGLDVTVRKQTYNDIVGVYIGRTKRDVYRALNFNNEQ